MRHLLFSFLTLSLLPLHAGVTAGSSTANANATATIGIGSLGDLDAISSTGSTSVRLNGKVKLGDSDPSTNPRSYVDATARINIRSTHSVYNPGPGYLLVIGGASTTLGMIADGVWAPNAQIEPTGSVTSTLPGNENIHTFQVTTDPIACTLSGSTGGSTTGGVGVALEVNQPGLGWFPVLASSTIGQPFNLATTLAPGEYRIRTDISLSATYPGAPVISGNAQYTLTVGSPPAEPFVPVPGEYTHPAVGTFFTDSPKLDVVNPVILTETPQGNGTTALVIRASLSNSSDCPWNALTLTIPESFPGGPDVTVTDGTLVTANDELSFGTLAANSTGAPSDPADVLTVLVADADLTAFRASILDGSRFTTRGRELWVFLYPVDVVENDRAQDLQASITASNGFSITFNEPPGFQVGTYYIEHEELSAIDPVRTPLPGGILDPVTGGEVTQGFDQHLPMLVTGIESILNINGPTQYKVYFDRLSFLETLKHGTVRSTVDLEHPSGLITTEGTIGDVIPKPQPIHFNRITIADAIDLSGTLLFDPGPIGVEFEMKNLALETFLVTANFSADATLLVETKDAADNTGQPVFDQEETLCSFPLFALVLPTGITLSPIFSMDVGAAVNAPRGLSVPIQSSAEINITAGMKNGVAYYESSSSAVPPKISTPALHQQLQAGVEAWVKAQLNCRVGLPGGAIGVGPTLGAKIGGNFQLAPLGDPWWSTQGELSLLAGVELDLAGLVTLYDAEQEIANLPLFEFDSGGPLLPPSSPRSINLPDNPGIRPVGGDSTRWARALQSSTATSPGSFDHFIHPLTGSDDFIAGGGNDVSRYGPDGELKWVLNSGENRRSVPNPDGGFTLLRGTFDRNLARFDGDGNRLWSVIYRTPTGEVSPNDLVVRIASGQPQYFSAGWTRTSLDNTKPALLKHDHDGNLLWSKVYQPVPAGGENAATEIQRALVTSDGHVVMIGMTAADIASGTTLANSPNSSANGFAMKVHGDTGAVLWTTLIAIKNIGSLQALAEGPDGSLYLGGGQQPGAFEGVPALFVTKLHADGSLIDSVLIGSATAPGAQATGYTASAVPHGGENVFDLIHDMTWADGSLWIAGKIGSPGGSIVTDGQSAFTARLTPELGVTRFAIHAGASADFIGAIAPGGDGLLACGWTRSFLPWPAGAANENAPSPVARLVMKLPWEGLLRFHELSNGKQPDADDPAPVRGSHYVYPRIIAASDTTLFRGSLPPDPVDPDAPSVHLAGDDLPLTVSDLALIPGFFPPAAPAKITPLAHHQIEFVPSEVIDGFSSYHDYHQTDTTEDSDHDGLDLATEFYHGTDPFVTNSIALQMTTHPLSGAPTLSFPRSELAAAEGWTAPIQKSGTLELWEPVPAANLDAFPNSSGELLYLNPFIIPGQQRQFYRLIPATAP